MRNIEFNWTTKDGIKLYAKEWAEKKNPEAVICLVHGLGEHCERYKHMAEYFTKKGYSIITFDIRGHGKSEGKLGHSPGYNFLMDDISLLINEANKRYPENKIFLFGHSMGGNLVLNYAMRRRPKIIGVIANGPALKTAFDPPAIKLMMGKLMRHIWSGLSLSNELDANQISRDPKVVKDYLGDPLVHNKITPGLAIDLLNTGIWAMDNASYFPLPLLLMHGEKDGLTSTRASIQFAKEAGDKCMLKIWKGCYHEVHNEPEQMDFFKYIIDWIKKF